MCDSKFAVPGKWSSHVRWIASGFITLALMLGAGESGATEMTGSMGSARYLHSAANLPDGRVLVAGGNTVSGSASGVTALSVIYDPSTGVFSPTGPLNVARANHAVATLADGRILVAGGRGLVNGFPAYLASAEIYNPATGAWTMSAPMGTARQYPVAQRLPDGRVLIISVDSIITSTEIFDPATETFSPSGSLGTARTNPAVATLSDGRVLVAGGLLYSGAFTSSSEIWNPAANAWMATGSMAWPRGYASATPLANGKVLVAGGYAGSGSNFYAASELYDPATDSFSTSGSLNVPRVSHVAKALQDGNVIVTGGTASTWIIESSIEQYDVVTGTWRVADRISQAVGQHTASLLPNGQVLIAGGSPGARATAELFDPACSRTSSISSVSQSFAASGGAGSVSLTIPAGCAWTVKRVPSWIAVTSGASGTGSGVVTFSVALNTTTWARSETLHIANLDFRVNQPAGGPVCNPAFVPTISSGSVSFNANGGSGSVAVTHDAGCTWAVTGVPSWITITSGATGMGIGIVNYSVAANSGSARSATLSIASNSYVASQAAPVVVGGNCSASAMTIGGTYSGTLAATDCTAGVRGAAYYTDRYSFTGSSGQRISIQLKSSVFDTYLYLKNPSGTVIASNDDGGGGTNSRVPASSGYFTLPVAGAYVIEVTSYGQGSTGAYSLSSTQY